MATSRHPVARNRLPLCPRKPTFSWPSLTSGFGRVGMWRGGGRIGLSVSAPFVWRCLNSRANYSVSTPRSSNRTCATNASGSRTRHHTFAHGRSRAAIRPTARAVEPQRHPIDSIARQPPMPPPGATVAPQTNARVLPSLRHAEPSATLTHQRSSIGLPQSPVLRHFQRQP